LVILVNRGWVPNKYKNVNERKKLQIRGPTEIIGILRLTETRPTFVFKNIPEQGLWNYRLILLYILILFFLN
jgi:cytochrome oxidase assembly protein ShyY1